MIVLASRHWLRKKEVNAKNVCECKGAHLSEYISGHCFKNEVQGKLLMN